MGIGDEVELQVSGSRYRYRVTSTQSIASKGPWDKVVAATPEETITIITCAGDFNRQTHTYDHRQVVKAVRLRT